MVKISKPVKHFFLLCLLILSVPIFSSIVTAFLKIDIVEGFECWCRQDSSQGALTNLVKYPTDYVAFVSPANMALVTNTSNLPTVANDSAGVPCLSFVTASSQYLALKPVALTINTGFTVTARVVFTGTAANTWERIFDLGNGSGTTGVILARQGNSTTLVSQLWNAGQASPYASYNNGIVQNQVMNVAYTFDPTVGGGTSSIYLNGTLVASAASQSAFAGTVTPTNFYIGRSEWQADSYATMNLYRLAVYNRVLKAAEITSSATSIA